MFNIHLSPVELLGIVVSDNKAAHFTITGNAAFDYIDKRMGMEETITGMDGTATATKIVQDFKRVRSFFKHLAMPATATLIEILFIFFFWKRGKFSSF